MRASLELDEPLSWHPALRVSSGSEYTGGMVSPASLRPVGAGFTGPAAPNINNAVTFFVLACRARTVRGEGSTRGKEEQPNTFLGGGNGQEKAPAIPSNSIVGIGDAVKATLRAPLRSGLDSCAAHGDASTCGMGSTKEGFVRSIEGAESTA